MLDLRQTDEYADYLQALGWRVETTPNGVKAYLKRLPILPWWILKLQRMHLGQLDMAWLKGLRHQYRIMKTYLELADSRLQLKGSEEGLSIKLKQVGFREAKTGMLPTKTRQISLTLSQDEWLKQMKRKTRYNLGLAKRKGLDVGIVGGGMIEQATKEVFVNLVLNSGGKHKWFLQAGWVTKLLEAFGNKAYVIEVKSKEGELLAGALFLMADDMVYYSYNGATEGGRRMMAPTLAVWAGMVEAKRKRIKWLDFDGVYDERYPIAGFKGFSRFKAGFGGVEVEYLPPYECWFPRW